MKLKNILSEQINNINEDVSLNDIIFSIHSNKNNNLITFIPKTKADVIKINKNSKGTKLFAVADELAKIYTKKTGIKFIADDNWMVNPNHYSIKIDMDYFIKKFIL